MKIKTFQIMLVALLGYTTLTASSCAKKNNNIVLENNTITVAPVGPEFVADSAMAYCSAQCEFGPRTMNSDAHDRCGKWIAAQFERLGCEVERQDASLTGYDGTMLRSTNIIARHNPKAEKRMLLCAHWDSRPWADNDPDEANWRKPVMAANDGASGVAVMLEVARLLKEADTLNVGVDFVCFDAEDWGVPQWSNRNDPDSWALGSQYWSTHYEFKGAKPRFGILLDMVGGQGATFYQEGMSTKYAPGVVENVWTAAHQAGYSQYFPFSPGGAITDDHIPVNENAGIPTIDIIAYYPDCKESSFGPTWHTVSDDMQHIDPNTLKAVGQTIIQVIFTSHN